MMRSGTTPASANTAAPPAHMDCPKKFLSLLELCNPPGLQWYSTIPHSHSWGCRGNNQSGASTYCLMMGTGCPTGFSADNMIPLEYHITLVMGEPKGICVR